MEVPALLARLPQGADGGASIPDHLEVSGITNDHREVNKGMAFACVPGERVDGHDFAEAAVSRGATLLLAERALPLPVPVIVVPSVPLALGPAAAYIYGDPSRSLVCSGVTGTNGKTTTTYLLDGISQAAGFSTAMIGTTGVVIDGTQLPTTFTTPQAPQLQQVFAQCVTRGVQQVAMEVSSHALAQHRVDGTQFQVVGFSNLTRDHLDYHGDVETYFAAKQRLFVEGFASHAVINVDDPRGQLLSRVSANAGYEVWEVGRQASRTTAAHALVIEEVALGTVGFTANVSVDGKSVVVRSPLLGAFNVENALLAMGMALANGIDIEASCAGLASPQEVPGRMESIPARDRVALVDFAHTPDALERVLRAARPLGKRVILVFGCGGDRDPGKRAPMGEVAARLADISILTNDNSRSESPEAIASEVMRGMGDATVIVELDRTKAISLAVEQSQPGDVILVAGKGHEQTQTIDGVVQAFDDRVVVRAALHAAGLSG